MSEQMSDSGESSELPSPQARDFAESINQALQPRPVRPGFAIRPSDQTRTLSLPPWFIDRCRKAYLAVPLEDERGGRVLGVTSPSHGEGKTSVAIGIATAIAVDTQEPTVLVECDLERPSFYRFFGLEREGGLSEWLEGVGRLRVVRAAFLPNAFVIPAGAPPPEPARQFYQLSESRVVPELRSRFRNVIIDLPPVLDIAYGSLAQQLVDRIIMVAKWGVTTIEALERVTFLLGHDRISGVVLNGTDYRTPSWLRALL